VCCNYRNFFKINRDRYNIPELLIEEGLYCTAFYLNQYHRAVIVNVLPNLPNAVRVSFFFFFFFFLSSLPYQYNPIVHFRYFLLITAL
jgi:hypothetical protein